MGRVCKRYTRIKPAAWWGDQGGHGAAAGGLKLDQRVAENVFMSLWQPKGFTFIDMDALAGVVRQAGVVTADLNAEQLREIKNLSGCDVVITGSVVATKEHDVSGMAETLGAGLISKVTGATCTATLSVRAINADNGEVWMRKSDHQLIQPLYISVFAKADGKAVKHEVEHTGFGFKTLASITARDSQLPECAIWRASGEAVRKTLAGASGKTTEPMSRPSATRPGGRR